MAEKREQPNSSAQGLSSSLSELYPRYFNRVFAFAYGRLADRDNALDLTQEVFLRFIASEAFKTPRGHMKQSRAR